MEEVISNKLFNYFHNNFDYMYFIDNVRKITRFISSPQGHRLAGTKAEHDVAKYIADEMVKIGLEVSIEKVNVDTWNYKSAYVKVKKPLQYSLEASTFAGITSTNEILGDLVFCKYGRKKDFEKSNVKNKIALIDLNLRYTGSISIIVREAEHHGIKGIIFSHLSPGEFSSAMENTLFALDSQYYKNAIPAIYIRRKDALELLKLLASYGNVSLSINIDAEIKKGEGYNIIGKLKGESDSLIIVAAHHDAYFYGAVDNAAGVSMLLHVAKSLRGMRNILRNTLLFISFTAEEYGIINSLYDYLIGSYTWVEKHRELYDRIELYANIDAIGFDKGPILLYSTPDLHDFTLNYISNIGSNYPLGSSIQINYFIKPSNWLDMWNFVRKGVPCIHFGEGNMTYYLTYYHTEKDDPTLISEEKSKNIFTLITSYLVLYNKVPYPSKLSSMLSFTLNTIEKYFELKVPCIKKLDYEIRDLLSELYAKDEREIYKAYKKEYKKLKREIMEILYRQAGSYPTNNEIKMFFEEYCDELVLLNIIISYLNDNAKEKALQTLLSINLLKWAKNVSKETFEHEYKRIENPLYWGEESIHRYNKDVVDLYFCNLFEKENKEKIREKIYIILEEREKSLETEINKFIDRLQTIKKIIININ